uniref:RBR-type E3 ubiquitin transferase n=1 Tax=Aegilops tauschii TaxID=37682 RepID=M8AQ02_AEGTA
MCYELMIHSLQLSFRARRLMALEAIYGDDLVEFGKKGGLDCFQIYIHYDLHHGAQVCAKFSSADGECPHDGTEDDGDEPEEYSCTCNLDYLPPLVLTCLLPQSYPSKDPPYFTITAKWMDGSQVSQICAMLDDIWAQLPGQEVVYQWVEWIRNSSLSHLWIDGKIILGLESRAKKPDNRAISRGLPLDYLIPSMLRYSSKKRRKAFLEDLHMCMICLNESNGSNFIQLPCEHLFCVKCMETLCRMHVKEGSVFRLVCPDTNCNSSIPSHLLKNLLREEEFERWDRLVLEKALASMSDVVYCPRRGIACLADEDNSVQCPKCSFTFCSVCKDPRHPGKPCLIPEQKLQQRQASGKLTAREMVQEMLMIRKLYKDARACPYCRVAIIKTEGCNHMYCVNCGKSFCFRCGKALGGGTFDHLSKCGMYAQREDDTNDLQKRLKELQTMERRARKHSVLYAVPEAGPVYKATWGRGALGITGMRGASQCVIRHTYYSFMVIKLGIEQKDLGLLETWTGLQKVAGRGFFFCLELNSCLECLMRPSTCRNKAHSEPLRNFMVVEELKFGSRSDV